VCGALTMQCASGAWQSVPCTDGHPCVLPQARNCHTRYQEYHRCMAQTGGDEEKCSPFARAYRSLCPTEWIERWNEAREEGRWTGRY